MPHPLVQPIEALAPLRAAGRVLAGLDLGTKTIGVAVGDRTGVIATPLAVIQRTRFGRDVVTLMELLASRAPAGFVVGLPVDMDGGEGPRAQSARRFADDLAGRVGLPVALWDERWSTAAVTRAMIDADMSRAKRAKVVDRAAAAWILQGALDRLSRLPAAS